MKYILKEFPGIDYSSYKFPYQIYAEREADDTIDEIYSKGFLQTRIKPGYYYMARGMRVNLKQFELSSENRRILRKTEYINSTLVQLDSFQYSYEIGKFAKDYYDSRFGPGTLSSQKVKWIFTSGAFTHTFVIKDSSTDSVIGYCPLLLTSKLMHYAYPFYSIEYLERNLGMGMMLHAIVEAKELDLDYVYLGTCYSQSSLYKTQFQGVEWFDGNVWSQDIEKLKELCKQ